MSVLTTHDILGAPSLPLASTSGPAAVVQLEVPRIDAREYLGGALSPITSPNLGEVTGRGLSCTRSPSFHIPKKKAKKRDTLLRDNVLVTSPWWRADHPSCYQPQESPHPLRQPRGQWWPWRQATNRSPGHLRDP